MELRCLLSCGVLFGSLLLICPAFIQVLVFAEESIEDQNPEEGTESYLTEGDMILEPNQEYIPKDPYRRPSYSISNRKIDKVKWPGGEVPYVIDSRFTSLERSQLKAAIRTIQQKTCVKFEDQRFLSKSVRHYIFIRKGNPNVCASHVGMSRNPRAQVLDFGRECFGEYGLSGKGRAMHELMHALGFLHEQSRHDRKYFVVVKENRVRDPKLLKNFKIRTDDFATHNTPYDYGSIMHYHAKAFGHRDSSLRTIIPRNTKARIGQREKLSFLDVYEINKAYDCKAHLNKDVDLQSYAYPIILHGKYGAQRFDCEFQYDLCTFKVDARHWYRSASANRGYRMRGTSTGMQPIQTQSPVFEVNGMVDLVLLYRIVRRGRNEGEAAQNEDKLKISLVHENGYHEVLREGGAPGLGWDICDFQRGFERPERIRVQIEFLGGEGDAWLEISRFAISVAVENSFVSNDEGYYVPSFAKPHLNSGSSRLLALPLVLVAMHVAFVHHL